MEGDFYEAKNEFHETLLAQNYTLGHSAHDLILVVKKIYMKEPSKSSYKLNERSDRCACQCGDTTFRKLDDAYTEAMKAVKSLLNERQ